MFSIVALYVSPFFWFTVFLILTTFTSMFFKRRYGNAEPRWVPNITCFSIILSLSLTGAVGLAIHAGSGGAICEEFLSPHPEKCMEASFAVAMSWSSVIIGEQTRFSPFDHDLFAHLAVAGILVSWFDRRHETVEVAKLPGPSGSFMEIQFPTRRYPPKAINFAEPIHIPRHTPSHTPSPSSGPNHGRGPTQPVPARIFTSNSRRTRVPSSPLSTSLSEVPSGHIPLMLHRNVTRPVGRAPNDLPIFAPDDTLRTPYGATYI